MMHRAFYLLAITLFMAMLTTESVLGCSCMGGSTPCHAFGGSSAVFVGTAIAVKTAERNPAAKPSEVDWTPRTFKFSVEQAYLGVEGADVEVATGMGGGDCGYGFKLGERYLVYAYRSGENNRLATGICTRTKPYSMANEDLEFLGTLSSMAPGVTIYGEIKRERERVAKGDVVPVGPLDDASLVVEGEGERKEVRADAQGRYRVSGLRPGKFKVTLQLPDELTVYKREQEVTVADRGCANVNYYVVDNGRISGRVFDSEGQAGSRLLLALVEADDLEPDSHYSKLERTDDEGRYNFAAVPPGRYLLVVNLTRYPQPDDPTNAYPRTFYPGSTDRSRAEVITLGAGENLRDRDLRLPVRHSPSVISGKVLWADGTPVANASISFRDVTYQDPGIGNGGEADEKGHFTIKAYVGQVFVIEARSNRPYVGDSRRFEPMERVEPLKITVANPSERVKIVITKLR